MSSPTSQDRLWETYQNDPQFRDHGCPGGGRHRYLARKIGPGESVLNIGAGNGALERLLSASGAVVATLDPSATTVARLRDELDLGDRAQSGYSQAIPFADASFDAVIMTEVLEHLADAVLSASVREVARVLRPGGRFLGTVPADEDLTASIMVCPKCDERFHRWGHQQSFSAQRLQDVLAQAFHRTRVQRRVFDDLSALNVKGKLVHGLRVLQTLARVRGSGQNFYFEAFGPHRAGTGH